MLCNICLKHKNNLIQLACSHNVCHSCIPKYKTNDKIVQHQCSMCLGKNKLQFNQGKFCKLSQKEKRIQIQPITRFQQNQNQTTLFCWTCTQLIQLNQFLKGRHQGHNVQTYTQSVPLIKNKMIEQLQKSLTILQYLKQSKKSLEQNQLKENYLQIIEQINTYFNTQHKILQIKRQQTVLELENNFTKSLNFIKKQLDIITPSLDDTQEISNKIENFLMDKICFNEFDSLKDLSFMLDQLMKSIKQKSFQIPELPIFVEKCSIKQAINQSCVLYINNHKYKKINEQVKDQKSLFIKLKKKWSENEENLNQIKENSLISTSSSKLTISNEYKLNMPKRQKQHKMNHSRTQSDKKVDIVSRVKGKMRMNSILQDSSAY